MMLEKYGRNKCLLICSVLALLLGGSNRAGASDPAYFNWRYSTPTDSTSGSTYDMVGPIRDQGTYNTCWIFGAVASYESSWNRQLKANELLTDSNRADFAER